MRGLGRCGAALRRWGESECASVSESVVALPKSARRGAALRRRGGAAEPESECASVSEFVAALPKSASRILSASRPSSMAWVSAACAAASTGFQRLARASAKAAALERAALRAARTALVAFCARDCGIVLKKIEFTQSDP